jgi:uncharacterized protein (DUF1015 family)
VPYDVVNREESAALTEGKPNSLLHVDRAEIDLPPETDPYSAVVYETARANFEKLQKNGALLREKAPQSTFTSSGWEIMCRWGSRRLPRG